MDVKAILSIAHSNQNCLKNIYLVPLVSKVKVLKKLILVPSVPG
jgi:hypothetical protein